MGNDSVEHTLRADFFNSITIGFEADANATLSDKKTIRQVDYEGFSECDERIGGGDATMQSYRGGGTVGNAEHEFRTYQVEAVLQFKLASSFESDRKQLIPARKQKYSLQSEPQSLSRVCR